MIKWRRKSSDGVHTEVLVRDQKSNTGERGELEAVLFEFYI